MKLSKLSEFYFITDSDLSRKGTLSDVENALKAGCRIIQYREKNKTTREMIIEAKKIKELCHKRAVFLVNDRVDVALAVDSDGVHLGGDDMPVKTARDILGKEKIIGLSVHNLKEAIDAEKTRADYIGIGPVFETTTKKDAEKTCGIAMINKIKKEVKIPIVAIGGINKKNIREVIRAGADSAAVVSAVVCSDDVFREVLELTDIIKENRLK